MVQTLLLDRTKVPELQRFHRLVSPITKPLLGAVRFSSLSRLKEHLGGHHFASGDEAFPSRRTILSWWMYDTTWTLAKVRRRRMWLCGDISNWIEVKIKFKTVLWFDSSIYTHFHTKSTRHCCLAKARICTCITKCSTVLKVFYINIVIND